MGKDLNISILLDFYGQLLTDRQAEALEYYYNDDLSLAEIADIWGISRQGVRDFLKRGEKQLEEFEEKLGLAKRFQSVKADVEEISALAKKLENNYGEAKELLALKKLADKVIDSL